MSEQRKKNEKNFLVQGSILAIAGVITKLIGAFYRIPLLNIIGTEGNGYYSVAFSIYVRRLPVHRCDAPAFRYPKSGCMLKKRFFASFPFIAPS